MKRITVIDDSEINGMLIRSIFQKKFEIQLIENPLVAINEMEKTVPDLILLDIMMPDLDGIELLKMIKAHPLFFKTPVVMVSAKQDLKTIDMAKNLGADDYITKPFVNQDLVDIVSNFI
jgi:PleD family two-component response regulator